MDWNNSSSVFPEHDQHYKFHFITWHDFHFNSLSSHWLFLKQINVFYFRTLLHEEHNADETTTEVFQTNNFDISHICGTKMWVAQRPPQDSISLKMLLKCWLLEMQQSIFIIFFSKLNENKTDITLIYLK